MSIEDPTWGVHKPNRRTGTPSPRKQRKKKENTYVATKQPSLEEQLREDRIGQDMALADPWLQSDY